MYRFPKRISSTAGRRAWLHDQQLSLVILGGHQHTVRLHDGVHFRSHAQHIRLVNAGLDGEGYTRNQYPIVTRLEGYRDVDRTVKVSRVDRVARAVREEPAGTRATQ